MAEVFSPPTWIRKRDGRQVAFEPDKICRSLFAATEALGRPNAFLARELTDSVLHFLAADAPVQPLTTADLSDTIAKVVRELGQPALARHLQQRCSGDPPRVGLDHPQLMTADAWRALARETASERMRELSLQEVFPRNLVAAHRQGLLKLLGLEHPFEMWACVLGANPRPSTPGQGAIEALKAATERVGSLAVWDSPEYRLAEIAEEPSVLASEFVRELRAGIDASGLPVLVNLNLAQPPTWIREAESGPLFPTPAVAANAIRRAEIAEAIVDAIVASQSTKSPAWPQLGVAWHIDGSDIQLDRLPRLQRLARQTARGLWLEFVLDRSRRVITLGPGLTRQHPAVLLAVGAHLPTIARDCPKGNIEQFLTRVSTLARLARSAGHAKQGFLRRRGAPGIHAAFLMDRARLMVIPIGLNEVVRQFSGGHIFDMGPGTQLAGRILRQLRSALATEPPHSMSVCVDRCGGPPACQLEPDDDKSSQDGEPIVPLEQRARALGLQHAAAEGGWAVLRVPSQGYLRPTELARQLAHVWRKTEISRLSFQPVPEKLLIRPITWPTAAPS